MKKFALGFILLLSLFSILVPLSKVNIVKAESTIYIRADGSVEGTDKIQRDGNVYTFTGDISIDSGDCGIEVDRDNIVIDGAGFALQGTAAYISRGIDLSSRSNVTIKNMEIRNFMDGIYLVPSSNNTITRNNITANTDSGIWTAGVSNNITGNYIANNNIGILFDSSRDLIYHNNFINNTKQVEDICWTNPWLPSSANILDDGYPSGGNYWSDYEGRYPNATELDGSGVWNTTYVIDENNQDNYPLLHRYGSIRNLDTNLTYFTIQSAIDAPQTLDGHTIYVEEGTYYEHVTINKSISLIGENRSTTIIDGNETGTIVTITAGNVSISGFTMQHGGFDQSCIYLSSSSGVTINDNAISNNFEGIHLNSSNGNYIADNLISPYAAVGIFLEYSNGNVISGNVINPGIGLDQIGILLTYSTENSIINNTILNNVSDGIKLIWSADNNIIKNNTLSNNGKGIFIIHSSRNTIINNRIVDKGGGIIMEGGNGNTVIGNTLSNNWGGISFSYSSYDNIICHNNFINNTHQIGNPIHSDPLSSNRWDNGLEGNYWSDYTGQDANLDGIGDTPYIADGDNYPLMGMFHDFAVEIELGQICHVYVISNSTVSNLEVRVWLTSANEYLQPGDEFIYYVVDGEEGSFGFCRIMIPRVVLNESYVVLVDWHEVSATELPFSNSTHAYLYFTYNHSTQEVIIIPEFPTWTSMLLLFVVLTVAVAIYKRRLFKTPIH